ncbi:unnamed protein product [Caenorhabditis angaria]|uniref:UDENN FLCN/SMCR8-type domain-containing protein n=1 Tax=Caenorhabditis angaria TaxID=860376 RepID=A0A9P1ILF0_9PELO|nr:unnamed protein product [Caenorhabditis angaria]
MPTRKMISFEDFLLRPSKVVDPFNRFVAKIEPFITMVEFCQVIGPRPLAVVSKKENNEITGVDINEMAIWLMSSDTVPGTIIVLENTQTGTYAMAYYFNLYDMRARAFQRSLCIAFLSSEKPNKESLQKFSTSMKRLISPVLICNRRLFIRHVTDIVKFSDSIDESTVQQYYSLNGEPQKVPDVGKFNVVFEQTRLLKSKFLTKKFQETAFDDDICCGHNIENMAEVEDIICSFRVPSVPLSPVETLTPCAYSSIVPKLRTILDLCVQKQSSEMIGNSLFCGAQPISRLSSSAGPSNAPDFLSDDLEGEETLKAVTGHLGDVLYPILCGDDMIVCGNEQRRNTVEDMLQKLHQITPKPNPRIENIQIKHDPNRIGNGLGGLECQRNETGKLARWRNILDMNRCVLKSFTYDGVLLTGLNKKRKFPSDRSLILFIVSYLTNICSLAYICRFLIKTYDGMDKIDPKILEDDEKILVNFLIGMDFEKFNSLKMSPSKNKEGPKSSRTINL